MTHTAHNQDYSQPPRPSLCPLQAPVQRGVSQGDLIVTHGDADRPFAPHQHAQLSGARDGGVEQVALQHHIVGGQQRDHHRREL